MFCADTFTIAVAKRIRSTAECHSERPCSEPGGQPDTGRQPITCSISERIIEPVAAA